MQEKLRRLRDTLSEGARRWRMNSTHRGVCGYMGWIGHGNLGDEVLFEAAQAICKPVGVTGYLHENKERRLARFGLAGPGYFKSVMLGGGTLINQAYEPLIRMAVEEGHEVWTFGSGVGSYGFGMSDADLDLSPLSDLLPRFKGLGVRGPISEERLHRAGFTGAHVIGDTALSLVPSAPLAPSGNRYVLNLTLSPDQSYDRDRFPFLRDLEGALNALKSAGWAPVPIAMRGDDIPFMQTLLASAYDQPPAILTPKSWSEFAVTVRSCSFCIGVRLHTGILACAAGMPVVMLGYRDKCLDFMRSMDLEEWHVDINDCSHGSIIDSVCELRGSLAEATAQVNDRVAYWRGKQREYVRNMLDLNKGRG